MGRDAARLRNILLVDDDPHDVELTLAALAAQHLVNKIDVVGDGAEALDYLHRRGKHEMRPIGNPVFVLLDNKMPKVSGLDVLKEIRAYPGLRMIPVVALTSSRETSDLEAFYALGVNAYVVKPVDFSDFMTAITRLGCFWAIVNESPTGVAKAPTGGSTDGEPAAKIEAVA